MKNHLLPLLAVALSAAPAAAQSAARSPLLGTWAVDVSKLPIPADQRPKSVTFTYTEAGEGKWSTQVDIVASDGSATHGTTSYLRDGTAWPVQGSPEADTTAVMTPQPGVLVMALSKGGVPGSIRIYTVAPDGKSMIETATYFTREGKPVMRTNYFNRVR
ncbi:MAG: hypothetical protein J7485_12495 [Sphingobium sp.]|nr:hypothetical protein [Sphingobium sp.]